MSDSEQWVDAARVRIRPRPYLRALGGDPARVRYIVKWRVRTDHSRSFQPGPDAKRPDREAQAFWDRLDEARRTGDPFHAQDGLPAHMRAPAPSEPAEAPPTVATAADLGRAVIAQSWRAWSPGNRRSRVESMSQVLAALVDPDAARPPARRDLARAARDLVLPPPDFRMEAASVEVARAAQWLLDHSLAVDRLSLVVVEEALQAAARKSLDGHELYATDRRGQQRTSLSLICAEAVRRGMLPTNPVRDAKRIDDDTTAPHDAEPGEDVDGEEVDPARVANPEQCRQLVARLCEISWNTWRYRAFLTLLWTTGMRPSEASGIRLNGDLHLPADGWGWVRLRRPTVATGRRWTGTGTAYADRTKLKGRARGKTRLVPLPPEAVQALRVHLARSETGVGERVFLNSQGQPFNPSAMGKLFRVARAELFPDGPLSTLTMYQLRHSAASLMLGRGGVSVVKAAEVLGNSPAVLMRTYARVLDTDDADFRSRMDAAFSGSAFVAGASGVADG